MDVTVADDVLREIEESVKTYYLPIIGPGKGEVLAELLRKYNSKGALEMGMNFACRQV